MGISVGKWLKERRELLFFLCFNFLLFGACLLIRTPVFWTDDDWGIANMISGARGEAFATPYVKFVNIVLSTLMYYLYKWIHAVNWFGLGEVVIVFVSYFFLSIYFINKKGKDKKEWIYYGIVIFFLLIFAPWSYVKIQFSQTAEIGCFSSALIYIYSYEVDNKKKSLLLRIIAITVMTLSALYRTACLLLICPFVLSECIFLIVNKKDIADKVRVYVKLFLLIMIIYIGGGVVQKVAYDVWDDEGYTEFNNARAGFLDYSQKPYPEVEEYLLEQGISFNDYELVQMWNFEDPVNIDADFFRTLSSCQDNENRFNIIDFCNEFKINMDIESYYIFLILGVLLSICSFENGKVFIWLLALVNAISLFFTWIGRYPSYVKNMVFVIASYLLIVNSKGIADKAHKKILVITAMLFLVLYNNKGYITNASASERMPEGYEAYKELNSYSDCVFVTGVFNTGGLKLLKDSYSVFETPESGIQRNIVGLGGWSSRHPVSNAHFEALGIYSPILQMSERNIYILASPDWIMKYQQYIYEHTGEKTCFGKAKTIHGASVFKVMPTELEWSSADFVEKMGSTNSDYSDEIGMLAFVSYVEFSDFVNDKKWNVYYQLTNIETDEVYNVMAYDYMMDSVESKTEQRVMAHMPMTVLNYGDTFDVRIVLEDCETGNMYCDYDQVITVKMLQ